MNRRCHSAADEMREALEINPRYARAFAARGLVCVTKGYFDEVVADAKKALGLDPTDKFFQSLVAELEAEIEGRK